MGPSLPLPWKSSLARARSREAVSPSFPDTEYNPILQGHLISMRRCPQSQFYPGGSIYTTARLGSHPDQPAGPNSSRNRVPPSHSQTISGPGPRPASPWQLITHSPLTPTTTPLTAIIHSSRFLTIPHRSLGCCVFECCQEQSVEL